MTDTRTIAPAPVATADAPASCKAQVFAYVRQRYGAADRIDAPAVAREVRQRFGSSPEFLDALAAEFFAVTVYQMVREWLVTTRRPGRPRQSTSPLALIQSRPSRNWARFMEHTGNAYVRVLQMTKAELLEAASARRAHAEVHAGYANTWEKLAARLQRDDERVCERWTVDEVAAVYSENGVPDHEEAD